MESKIRFKFNKIREFKYLSHLETARLMIMAINRAGINVKYSSGFNPNPKISFSFPVPVGLASFAEYSDVEITRPLEAEQFSQKMNMQLKEGMSVVEARNVSGKIPSLMSDIKLVRYCFLLKNAEEKIAEKLINEIQNNGEFCQSIYSMDMVKNEGAPGFKEQKETLGTPELHGVIVKLNLIGYTVEFKNNKIFKFNNFLKYFKYLSNSYDVGVKDYFKEEAYMLREGVLKTPLEIV